MLKPAFHFCRMPMLGGTPRGGLWKFWLPPKVLSGRNGSKEQQMLLGSVSGFSRKALVMAWRTILSSQVGSPHPDMHILHQAEPSRDQLNMHRAKG